MASGRLATAQLTPGVGTVVYTCPAGRVATVNFSILNQSLSDGVVDVAVIAGASPVSGEYIEKNSLLLNCEGFERTAIVLTAGQKLHMTVSFDSSEVNVWGFEE